MLRTNTKGNEVSVMFDEIFDQYMDLPERKRMRFVAGVMGKLASMERNGKEFNKEEVAEAFRYVLEEMKNGT